MIENKYLPKRAYTYLKDVGDEVEKIIMNELGDGERTRKQLWDKIMEKGITISRSGMVRLLGKMVSGGKIVYRVDGVKINMFVVACRLYRRK